MWVRHVAKYCMYSSAMGPRRVTSMAADEGFIWTVSLTSHVVSKLENEAIHLCHTFLKIRQKELRVD